MIFCFLESSFQMFFFPPPLTSQCPEHKLVQSNGMNAENDELRVTKHQISVKRFLIWNDPYF